MILNMPKTEFDIPIFSSARNKLDACQFRVDYCGQEACVLFKYRFDTSADILNHCGSCKLNTKEPTTMKGLARSL